MTILEMYDCFYYCQWLLLNKVLPQELYSHTENQKSSIPKNKSAHVLKSEFLEPIFSEQ